MGRSGRQWDDVVRMGEYLGHSVPPRLRGRTLVLDDPMPCSYTIGFLRPSVVVSTGLFNNLDRDEVEAVLAHEEAHLAARDNLVLLIAQTVSMTFVLVPGVRLAFARLRRFQEMAADDFATRRTGDCLLVASSLQKFARSLFFPANPAMAMAFAEEGNVTERIEDLLLGTRVRGGRWAATALLALLLLFGAFATSAVATTGVTIGDDAFCGAHSGQYSSSSVTQPDSCTSGH
jgi:Zn-dependent protease with chaperone function